MGIMMSSDILIVTNGTKESFPAIEQGAWLAADLNLPIMLLGITERLDPAAIDSTHPLEDVFERAVSVFKAREVAYRLEVRNGSAEKVLPYEAKQNESIVVLGPLGRPQLQRMMAGRSIRHFIEEIEQPLLYVPETRVPVKKILIAVGGLGYDVNAEHIAMQVAVKSGAEIVLLHIVPPIDLNYPTAQAVSKNWQHLTETDTPVGRSLRKSLENAQTAGLSASVKVRHGNVIEEIVAESQEGNYELLCMGSSYSVHSLRQMYSANVTAEIMERVRCPVMTARFRDASV
ncbi:MAG: universal stress protein [Anaerolineales bacterium]|uniref:universal stress protein n=1 Tax=Candidatus Villigracilis vicinus TaxID=3140679 RepID=UPI003134C9F1|nr:universal stress protein [Anaerolineales bacterium]